jgi:chloramphenicol O-acetyltransferase type A
MPLAIQVHHAVCDGIHVAKLIDTLQQACTTIQTLK